jgi:hypothetical protein
VAIAYADVPPNPLLHFLCLLFLLYFLQLLSSCLLASLPLSSPY